MNVKKVLSYATFFVVLTYLCGSLTSFTVARSKRKASSSSSEEQAYFYNDENNGTKSGSDSETSRGVLSNGQLKALLSSRKCSHVDAVFTWVNGSDTRFQTTLKTYTTTSQSHRFNDYGTLRFSIRSVISKVPDLRYIYVVTNGQRPSWLNTNDPRVKLVFHKDIFLGSHKDYLPTFNSNSIELHIKNIPGLSECFLYLNDDFIVNKRIDLDYFIRNKKKQSMNLYFDRKYSAPKYNYSRSLWHIRSAYSNNLINKRYNPTKMDTMHKYTCHNVYFFRKTIIDHIYSIWEKELEEAASHRFRHKRDAILSFLHNNVALEEGLGKAIDCDTKVIGWRNNHKHNVYKWNSIPSSAHTFCLQDEFSNVASQSYKEEIAFLEKMLCKKFPQKSFAEVPSEPNPCDKY